MWLNDVPIDMQQDIVEITVKISSTLSIIGSLFIIVSFWYFVDSRKFSRKILLFLSTADLLASCAWLMSNSQFQKMVLQPNTANGVVSLSIGSYSALPFDTSSFISNSSTYNYTGSLTTTTASASAKAAAAVAELQHMREQPLQSTPMPFGNNTVTNITSIMPIMCEVQAYSLQFFYLASFFWTACFAFHLYQLIWKKNRKPQQWEPLYHVIAWGIPAAIDIYFFVRQYYFNTPLMGPSRRPWCWIAGQNASDLSKEQLLFYFIPLSGIFLFNICVYLFLAVKVRQVLASMELKIRKRLLLYLLVFVLCSVWGFVSRLYNYYHRTTQPNWILVTLDAAFGPLQGFLNSLVYGLNQKLRERYSRCLCGSRSGDEESSFEENRLRDDLRRSPVRRDKYSAYSSDQNNIGDFLRNASEPLNPRKYDDRERGGY
jgi:hypothetical protein